MKQLLIAVLSVFMLAGCATKQPSKNEVATTNKTETTTLNKNNKPSKNKKPVEKVEEHKDSSNSNSTDKQLENKPEVKPSENPSPSTPVENSKPSVESKPVNPQSQQQKPEEVKPTPQPEPQPTPQPEPLPEIEDPYNTDEYYREEAERLIQYISDYREEHGLNRVQTLPVAQAYADKRAQELLTNFSHDTQYNIYNETGFQPAGENIARGLNALGAFNAWKKSPGHNACMLGSYVVYSAIGFSRDEIGNVYCVLVNLTDIPADSGWQ